MSSIAEVSFKNISMWSNQFDKTKVLLLQGVVEGKKQLNT